MQGLRLRPYAGESDIPHLVRIENAEYEADNVPGRSDAGSWAAHLSVTTEKFDPARDVTVALVDDEVVAVAQRRWADANDNEFRMYLSEGWVHPDWRRRGIGTALIEHNQQSLRELAATHQTDRPRAFGSWSGDSQPGRIALLQKQGYDEVRWFMDMTRPDLDNVPDTPMPAGLELRPVTDDNILTIWHGLIEAFRDHWGGGDDSDEALRRYTDSPGHDPSLWLIAWDGEEVAGGVINGIEKHENDLLGVQRGWLHSVWTRRRWRRRGLAAALVNRSLILLRERGMTSAVLGVDVTNPTGAVALYERAGFKPTYRLTSWRKPFDL